MSILLTFLLLAGTALAAPAAPAAPAANGKGAVLTAADCAKCHQRQPAEIEAKGAAHKTQIDCQACHQGHRPAVANNIPVCSMCHSGSKHYELQGCSSCHNPHQPLDVVLKGDITEPCLTCHADQGQELASFPSKHAKVSCTFCHAERHGVVPECVQCHQPHSAQMTQADCRLCHQAHQPTTLTYGAQTASILCAACHTVAFDQLSATKSKHHDVACVTCHQQKHKTVPQCADCHGLPHAEGMHQKFPRCGDCHNIAHDLNNWPSKNKTEGKSEPAKPAAKKEVKKGK
jgi:predicted CXXCH cytochrome family protein